MKNCQHPPNEKLSYMTEGYLGGLVNGQAVYHELIDILNKRIDRLNE